MTNVIKEICQWQVLAGNADRTYEDFLESAFQVEEALEGLKIPYAKLFDKHGICIIDATISNKREKHIARDIIDWAMGENGESATPVQRLDKACDAIVYALGSMLKLGLDVHSITKALSVVNRANMQKLGCPRDAAGKLLKPDNFVEPEPELQKILDSIKK